MDIAKIYFNFIRQCKCDVTKKKSKNLLLKLKRHKVYSKQNKIRKFSEVGELKFLTKIPRVNPFRLIHTFTATPCLLISLQIHQKLHHTYKQTLV